MGHKWAKKSDLCHCCLQCEYSLRHFDQMTLDLLPQQLWCSWTEIWVQHVPKISKPTKIWKLYARKVFQAVWSVSVFFLTCDEFPSFLSRQPVWWGQKLLWGSISNKIYCRHEKTANNKDLLQLKLQSITEINAIGQPHQPSEDPQKGKHNNPNLPLLYSGIFTLQLCWPVTKMQRHITYRCLIFTIYLLTFAYKTQVFFLHKMQFFTHLKEAPLEKF